MHLFVHGIPQPEQLCEGNQAARDAPGYLIWIHQPGDFRGREIAAVRKLERTYMEPDWKNEWLERTSRPNAFRRLAQYAN